MALPEALVSIEPGRNKLGVFEDLRHVQENVGFVPMREIERIATRRGVAVKDVHTVASFYPHFRLKPPIRVDVRVCDDMTCHLRGATKLQRSLSRQYASASEHVQVRDISCVGRCDHAPHRQHQRALPRRNKLQGSRRRHRSRARHARAEGVHSPPPRSPEDRGIEIQCDPYATEQDHYSIFRKLIVDKDYDSVMALLKGGDLRGMGGAGFPTFIKWDGTRKSPGIEKFVVCNADESEPGTIKDRFILQYLPHMVFEGMMICGAITGAQRGYLYIRHEYELQTEVLREELARIYALGLLGTNIQGSGIDFDLEVFVSPGGYICGEETALMEAIQGNRSEPRNKPPRTVNSGVWNKPTALNNVETFCHAITILGKGGDWYKQHRPQRLARHQVRRRHRPCAQPRRFRSPHGHHLPRACRPLRRRSHAQPRNHRLCAVRSVVRLPARRSCSIRRSIGTRSRALGSMLGSGAVVVCDDSACMLDMALVASTLLPQRKLRQVLALPHRHAEARRPASKTGRSGHPRPG